MRSHNQSVAPEPRPQIAVDIIILDWNRPAPTIRAIRSALAQRGVARKVWVVDQGSQPAHRSQLAAYCDAQPDVHVHWLGSNVGVAAGRNIATRFGSAPYVVSLDNDAVFADEHCVARAALRMHQDPQLGALAFRILDEHTRSDEQYWDYPPELRISGLPSFAVTRFLGGGHMLRRRAFESAGCYDERLFFGGEERDVAWRMIGQGYRLRLDRDLAVLHRSVPVSKLDWSDRRFYYLVRNTLYINHKFGAGPLGLAKGAGGFLLRGARNRLLPAAARGIASGVALSLRFSLFARDRAAYRLDPQARRYIDRTDRAAAQSWLGRLKRTLQPLPQV